MATPNLPIPMDHDGLSITPNNIQNPASIPQHGSANENASTTSIPPRRDSVSNNRPEVGGRRSSINSLGSGRIFCPVVGCPDALLSSNKHFRDIAGIKSHLDDHITGYRSGAVPSEFLRQHDYSQCDICDKIVHKRFHGTHPRCRTRSYRNEQINRLRNLDNTPNNTQGRQQQAQTTENPRDLPSLSIIHGKYVPTIKNIPRGLRRLFAQCMSKTLAKAVWSNDIPSWTELQMLPKST